MTGPTYRVPGMPAGEHVEIVPAADGVGQVEVTYFDGFRTGRRYIEANRLTDTDRARIVGTVRGALDRWSYGRQGQPWTPTTGDVLALERLAWSTIGCSRADLRGSELAEIASMVGDLTSERVTR